MGTNRKSTPWLNLAAGLLWLFIAVRDKWMPGFMSVGEKHDAGQAWLSLIVAAVFLFASCRSFTRMRASSAR